MTRHADLLGRYIYIELDEIEYRVYYEEAGSGPCVLLQHTAGADGRQWRHLLEDSDFTSRYRLIAHDLPFHGKSLPPVGVEWWKEEYALHQEFFMKMVVLLARELEAEGGVYVGCSMGGHLAPDLALYYPGVFSAVVALEGALATHDEEPFNAYMWHPRVSDEMKSALMYTMMAPTSPEAFRREVAWIYGQGGPPVHKGDLVYYLGEHDLVGLAGRIDTTRTAVYVLSGDYDWSADPKGSKQLADAIPGASYVRMEGLGHFPMSEDPTRFKRYLLPTLEEATSGKRPG